MHGGGCLVQNFSPRADYLDPVLTKLLNDDYSIISLDYRELPGTLLHTSCQEKVKIHLKRLVEVSFQINDISKNIPIIYYGHSYGGYLVNLLGIQNSLSKKVKGYISYAGVWDSSQLPEATSAAINPSTLAPNKKMKPMLILHSIDDGAVPIRQVAVIEKWKLSNKTSNPQVITFDKGGHYPINDSFMIKKIVNKMDLFMSILKKD